MSIDVVLSAEPISSADLAAAIAVQLPGQTDVDLADGGISVALDGQPITAAVPGAGTADPAGTAANLVAAHNLDADAHGQTATGRALVTAADAAAARTALGTDSAGTARPPTAHGHSTSEVTGLDSALAGKAATGHTHTPAEAGAEPSGAVATHNADTNAHGQTTTGRALMTAPDAAAARTTLGTDSAGTARPPTVHGHSTSEVTGLDSALAGKAATGHTHTPAEAGAEPSGAIATHNTDAAAHGQTATGRALVTAADAAAARTALGTDSAGTARPPTAHGHSTSEVTGLDSALAGKAATGHTHTPAEAGAEPSGSVATHNADTNAHGQTTTGRALVTATSAAAARSTLGTDAAGTARPPTAHGHVIDDTAGLQTALDGKSATGHTHTPAEAGAEPSGSVATHNADANAHGQTAIGRALVTAASAAAARSTLGTDAAGTARPPTAHGHVIDDTASLQTALDGKAATGHTHTPAEAGAEPSGAVATHNADTNAHGQTSVGRAVLTATDQAAARSAIGVDIPSVIDGGDFTSGGGQFSGTFDGGSF